MANNQVEPVRLQPLPAIFSYSRQVTIFQLSYKTQRKNLYSASVSNFSSLCNKKKTLEHNLKHVSIHYFGMFQQHFQNSNYKTLT